MSDIPKADLIKFCEDRLEAVRLRPLMYGGNWSGVEMIILDMLEMIEWARAYPNESPQDWTERWHQACAKAYRGGNTYLFGILEQDGITDSDQVQAIYNKALTIYELDGMTPTEMLSKATAPEAEFQRIAKHVT